MKIYRIWTFILKGATFKVHDTNPSDLLDPVNLRYSGSVLLSATSANGEQVIPSRYYEISTKPEGYSEDQKLLPYFADVTEDIPGSAPKGMVPKAYKHCQLTTQKPGGYLVFLHHESGKELKIAMNSHIYEPVN